MSIRGKIENNLIFVVGSFLLMGFLAGIGTYKWILDVSGLEPVEKATLCPKGTFGLTIDSYPKDTINRIVSPVTAFYQGTCLKPGRYEIESHSPGYSMLKHIVQIDRADQIAVINLRPIHEITLTGTDLKKYSGELLSLRFNDIEVEDALKLMANFTDNEFVLHDVTGRINLSLSNVPWDQALDVILLTNNLTIQRLKPNVYTIFRSVLPEESITSE